MAIESSDRFFDVNGVEVTDYDVLVRARRICAGKAVELGAVWALKVLTFGLVVVLVAIIASGGWAITAAIWDVGGNPPAPCYCVANEPDCTLRRISIGEGRFANCAERPGQLACCMED